jgi:hypothetical protein
MARRVDLRKLKKPLIFSALILLLALEMFVYLAFSSAPNRTSGLSEAEPSYGNPIFQKGMSFSAWSGDAFSTPESDESMRLLAETNTEWVAINFAWVQSNTTSTDIRVDPIRTATTESVRHIINTAHSLGFKVMLKPMLDTLEEEQTQGYPTVWRGFIQPSDEWFESYSNFINSFAEFAEQNHVELFSFGCELKATSGEKEQWEKIIVGVRKRFSGPITYAADWTNFQNIEWWDSVDYVGIDAYFPLTFNYDPSLEELKTAWSILADEIETWILRVKKPVIFTEIGYRSGDGTNLAPSNFWSDMTVDLQEQRDCYEAAFQTLWNRGWFYGFYWWTWIHDPEKGGPDDPNHTPQSKPAQDSITSWYSKIRKVALVDRTFTSADKSNINDVQSVGFHVSWEDDGSDVIGASIYVNGTEKVTNGTGWTSFNVAYDSVGKRVWAVTDFEHPEATAYRINVENAYIVWDEVSFDVEVNSASLGVSRVKVKVAYAYDGSLVTGVTTLVNGKLCEETEPGVYTVEISSWSPYQQITVETDIPVLSGETWATSTFHGMNLFLYTALVSTALVAVLAFLKLRKGNSSQPFEE